MDYRPEIDGLRALAVVPVMLFHARFETFKGGFVGVDVFFVISGYLITGIILAELEREKFSIVNFYERRARRILPALFLVSAVSLIAGFFTLMPHELKSLGQSLVATSLFSNNILLALTDGYWDLKSEFKPLLHTWSLGVEEQYYLVVPLSLLLAWKYCKEKIPILLALLLVVSLAFAGWFVAVSPRWAFFLLPARSWEIAIGALAATLVRSTPRIAAHRTVSNVLSTLGFALIVSSIVFFDETIPSPGAYVLVPTMGAAFIIVFATEGTLVHRILSYRLAVFGGLLSYSLYLWHQPALAFLRVISTEKPTLLALSVSLIIVFALAYLSWKYVEMPFRNKTVITRRSVFIFSVMGSAFLVASGLYLDRSYGLPSRIFDSSVRIEDIDTRIYNERVFALKADAFKDSNRKKLLIIGNSFGRDFANITFETYDTRKFEIVYRDDFQQCIFPYKDIVSENLFSSADVIVFSSSLGVDKKCLDSDLTFALKTNKAIFYVGTKDFGYNLNWLIWLTENGRRNRYNVIPRSVIDADIEAAKIVPPGHYISLLGPTLVANTVPITDGSGRMLSTDRTHLTKFGAVYFGQRAVKSSTYSEIFR